MAKQNLAVVPEDDTVVEEPKADTTKKAEAKARKVLTPAERVAKLEAELAEAKAKAEARENKAKTEATEKRAKLVAKRDELNTQIAALTEIIGDESTEG